MKEPLKNIAEIVLKDVYNFEKCVGHFSFVKLLIYSLLETPRQTSLVRYFNNVLTMIFIDCAANYINIFVKIFILAC